MINETTKANEKPLDAKKRAAFLPETPFTLTGDRVALCDYKLPDEKQTKGGILLPENRDKREDTQVGTVVAFGPGFYTHTGDFVGIEDLVPGIHVGARVAFQRNGVQETTLEVDGEKYLVVRTGEVVAVLHEKGA